MNFIDIFNDLFLEANPEKRILFLQDKYGAKLEQLFTKYRFDLTLFKNIYRKTPVEYIVNTIDPTDGTYADWITRALLIEPFTNPRDFERYWSEDFFETRKDLTTFHKHKGLFKTLAQSENDPNLAKYTDINQHKSLTPLHKNIGLLDELIGDTEDKEELKKAEKDAEKIYNSDNYLILIPKTQAASCAYGRGTRWCTAATGSQNYFNAYSKNGPLYIIIDKKNDEKFQFHFQSEQYMDADDDQLDVESFFTDHPEIKPFIIKLAMQNKNTSFVALYDPQFIVDNFNNSSEEEKIKTVQSSFYTAVLLVAKPEYREFVNSNQSLIKVKSDNDVILKSTHSNHSAFKYFIADGGSRSGISRKNAEAILDNENDYYGYDFDDFQELYWDWLNGDSEEYVINYVNQIYPELGPVATIEEAKTILTEQNDSEITSTITRCYSNVYGMAEQSAIHEEIWDKITDHTGSSLWVDGYIAFRQNMYGLKELATDIMKHTSSKSDDAPRCDWDELESAWVDMLDENGQLTSVNLDYIDIYPDENTYKGGFNESFQEELYKFRPNSTPQVNTESSIFDRYIAKFV